MSENLMIVSNQWAKRPADERFKTVAAAYDAAKQHADESVELVQPFNKLRAVADGEKLLITGEKAKAPVLPTFHAFGQLASRVGAPAHYLRELSPTLAAQNLNYGLARMDESPAHLLFRKNGMTTMRAVLTQHYERVWNHEVLQRVLRYMDAYGMTEMRPTFQWDGSAVAEDREAAVYVSDHDMFVGLLSKGREIQIGNERLFKFALFGNSEVGETSLWGMTGYLRDVCGNFILWGAQDMVEFRLTHRGTIHNRFADALLTVNKFFDAGTRETEAQIISAKARMIGANKDEVLDALFGLRKLGLTRKLIGQAYDAVIEDVDGPARSQWGIVQGLTRVSQQTGHTDERIAIDRAAARVMMQETF